VVVVVGSGWVVEVVEDDVLELVDEDVLELVDDDVLELVDEDVLELVEEEVLDELVLELDELLDDELLLELLDDELLDELEDELLLELDELLDDELLSELDELVSAATTGIVMIVVFGMSQVTAAMPRRFFADVVSCFAFSVMLLPAAPATTSTVTSGVVNVPGLNGPGMRLVMMLDGPMVDDAVRTVVPWAVVIVVSPWRTAEPGTKSAPWISYERLWFEYSVIVRPPPVVGSAADPPGKVSVNCSPGVTVSGPLIAYAMSTFWLRVRPASVAWHNTAGKTPCCVWALAGLSTQPSIAKPSVAMPAYTPSRFFQSNLTVVPPKTRGARRGAMSEVRTGSVCTQRGTRQT
jgi:hypothetical protein